MQANTVLASIALLAAAASTPLLAADRKSEPPRDRQHATPKQAPPQAGADSFDYGMQAVRNDSAVDTPGYGWRYFSDPQARRAVVISPRGDYYFSRGKGLRWVAHADGTI